MVIGPTHQSLLRMVALLLAVTCPATFVEAGSLDFSINQLSQRIHDYLTSHGIQHVRMGTFAGPSSTGTGIALREGLRQKLEKTGLEISKRAGVEVRGEFSAKINQGEPPAVVLHARLFDHQGHEMVEFRYRPDDIEDLDDVARLLSPTVDLAVDRSGTEAPSLRETFTIRDERVVQSLLEPSFHRAGPSIIAASPTSPFRMEVLSRDGNNLIPVDLEDFQGTAFVDLPLGRECVVRLYNDSDIDVGVKLMIDGVKSLELSENEDYRKLGLWVIAAKSQGTINGWHLTNARSLAFLIADAADSEAARLERDHSEIGTITASFYPAWTGDTRPNVELFGKTRGGRGMAAGAERQSNYQEAQRNFGKTLLATVSVRYEKPEVTTEVTTKLAEASN